MPGALNENCELMTPKKSDLSGGVMRSTVVYEGVVVTVASTATLAVVTKSWIRIVSIQFHSDTVLLCAFMTLLATVLFMFIRRSDRSLKLRLDLLFRMGYQGPFVQEIRGDEEERLLYGASILRKLRDLAELNRSYRDYKLCSYYIGCLAFFANEKRADLPWVTFRDEVAQHFAEEILTGKIARHVIDDHYKGMWEDLVAAAERTRSQRRPRIVLRIAQDNPHR